MVSFQLQIPSTPTRLDTIALPWLILGWLWASPVTVIVLAVVLLFGSLGAWSSLRLRDRFLECVPGGLPGAIFRWTGTGAAAWGTLILFRTRARQASPDVRQHEAEHVRWWMILGPFGPPAYAVELGLDAIRGEKFYRDNWFEEDARQAELDPNEPQE